MDQLPGGADYRGFTHRQPDYRGFTHPAETTNRYQCAASDDSSQSGLCALFGHRFTVVA
jgi:hypothetical protein